MAQWLYFEGEETVVFNDAVNRRLVCRIVTLGGRERALDWPIQALHPSGNEALSLNYRRLARIRPEYGYEVAVDNFAPDQPLDRDGLWRVDLRSGDSQLIVSLRQLAEIAPRIEMVGADHKVNHAVYSPGGERFVFMHRWLGSRGKFSRLYCVNSDGTGLRLLLDHRMVSHYAWRDENTVLVWARTPEEGDRYYLLDVSTDARSVCCAGTLDRFGDGHPSFSPDGQWIVTDTYPDRGRMRRLLLCRPAAGQVCEVGAFHSPWRYDGPTRCDLHPRWSADGLRISIDSSHEGIRGTYVIDVDESSRRLRLSRAHECRSRLRHVRLSGRRSGTIRSSADVDRTAGLQGWAGQRHLPLYRRPCLSEHFVRRNPRHGIHKTVRNESKLGLARSLNRLLDSLEDEDFVFRMDSDDYSHTDRISRQVEATCAAGPKWTSSGGASTRVDQEWIPC